MARIGVCRSGHLFVVPEHVLRHCADAGVSQMTRPCTGGAVQHSCVWGLEKLGFPGFFKRVGPSSNGIENLHKRSSCRCNHVVDLSHLRMRPRALA